MKENTLDEPYFTALRKMHAGEKQLIDSLPDVSASVASDDLSAALETLQDETRTHYDRLEKILADSTGSVAKLENFGVEALIREARAAIDAYDGEQVRDAALTAIVQHIEHYKIACYGSLSTYAKELDRQQDLDSLLQTLRDANSADEKLNDAAKNIVNAKVRVS